MRQHRETICWRKGNPIVALKVWSAIIVCKSSVNFLPLHPNKSGNLLKGDSLYKAVLRAASQVVPTPPQSGQ